MRVQAGGEGTSGQDRGACAGRVRKTTSHLAATGLPGRAPWGRLAEGHDVRWPSPLLLSSSKWSCEAGPARGKGGQPEPQTDVSRGGAAELGRPWTPERLPSRILKPSP